MKKQIRQKEESNVKSSGPSESTSDELAQYLLDRGQPSNAKALSSAIKNKRKEAAVKFSVPLPKVKGISEEEMFKVVKTGKKTAKKGWYVGNQTSQWMRLDSLRRSPFLWELGFVLKIKGKVLTLNPPRKRMITKPTFGMHSGLSIYGKRELMFFSSRPRFYPATCKVREIYKTNGVKIQEGSRYTPRTERWVQTCTESGEPSPVSFRTPNSAVLS